MKLSVQARKLKDNIICTLPFKPRDQPYGVCFERMFESD
jgi:hypothetical protein